jgi:hypothetical protein
MYVDLGASLPDDGPAAAGEEPVAPADAQCATEAAAALTERMGEWQLRLVGPVRPPAGRATCADGSSLACMRLRVLHGARVSFEQAVALYRTAATMRVAGGPCDGSSRERLAALEARLRRERLPRGDPP